MANPWQRLGWIGVLALVAGGCAGMGRPNWFHPGPAAYQQKRAERFDPYPEPDVAPEVVGARPREFQKPAPEPERARRTLPLFGR